MSKICKWCKKLIVVPHCDSKNCDWCRACHERKVEECGKSK